MGLNTRAIVSQMIIVIWHSENITVLSAYSIAHDALALSYILHTL